MVRVVEKWHGHPPCEMNLYGAMASGPLLVIGVLWLGWTGAYATIPWWVPALPTVLLGITWVFELDFIPLSYQNADDDQLFHEHTHPKIHVGIYFIPVVFS
jgi:hypothetical protein